MGNLEVSREEQKSMESLRWKSPKSISDSPAGVNNGDSHGVDDGSGWKLFYPREEDWD